MSNREPSFFGLVLITAWHGMRTLGEVICVAIFIFSFMGLAIGFGR